jgi:DNA-binding PadR family transcriptional regulator
MSKRRVSNPLALAVLACLAERPMHPYEMAITMRERHKDDAIKLNYGSLYAVMVALCRHKLIVARETVKEGRRPERTVYELTDAGSHELNDWLSELLSQPVKEFTHFEAGLSLMPVLPPTEAVALLEHRCDILEIGIGTAKSVLAHIREKNVARLFVIDREYEMALREAELNWTRRLIAEIKAGQIDGAEGWRDFHAGNSETMDTADR